MERDQKKGIYTVQVNQEYQLTLRSTSANVKSIPGGKIDIFLRNIKTGEGVKPCPKHGGNIGGRIMIGKDLKNESLNYFTEVIYGVSWNVPSTNSSSISTVIKFVCTNYEVGKSRMPWQFVVQTSSAELGGRKLGFDLLRIRVLSKPNRLEVLKTPSLLSETKSEESKPNLILPAKENTSKESETQSKGQVKNREWDDQDRDTKIELLREEFKKMAERMATL